MTLITSCVIMVINDVSVVIASITIRNRKTTKRGRKYHNVKLRYEYCIKHFATTTTIYIIFNSDKLIFIKIIGNLLSSMEH